MSLPILAIAGSGLALACSVAIATSPTCSSSKTCESLGVSAINNGNLIVAQNLFEQAADFAEDAGDKSKLPTIYNHLISIDMEMNDYENAIKWAYLVLDIDKANSVANENLNKILERYPLIHDKHHVTGTFVKYAGRGYWDELNVFGSAAKGWRFNMRLYRIGQAWREYGPSQLGQAHGALTGMGRRLTYEGDSDFPTCRIFFEFEGATVNLSQDGDCGFGYGLMADGTFKRIANDVGSQTKK